MINVSKFTCLIGPLMKLVQPSIESIQEPSYQTKSDIISATIHKNLISNAQQDSNVGLIPLENVILKNSIDVINNYHVSADDALHLYTAFLMKCDYFLCHDRKLVNKTKSEISTMKILNIADSYSMTRLTKELDSN